MTELSHETPLPSERVVLALPTTRALLAGLFLLAFVASPYWKLGLEVPARLGALTVLASLGLWWAHAAASEVRAIWRRFDLAWLAAAALIGGALAGRTLGLGLPWRGDEDIHVAATFTLVAQLVDRPLPMAVAAVALVLRVTLGARLRGAAGIAAWLVVALALAVAGGMLVLDPRTLVRYPFVTRWLSAVGVLAAAPFWGLRAELAYRLVPFATMVLTAWWLTSRARVTGGLERALYLGAISTVPLVRYYGSVLYVETPMVLLLTLAMLDGGEIVTAEPAALRRRPGWYGLLLAGFFKETVAPIVAVLFALRVVWRLPAIRRRPRAAVEEATLGLCAALPVAAYLAVRLLSGDPRSHGMQLASVADLGNWLLLLGSLGEQLGGLVLLAALGGLGWLRRRAWSDAAVAATWLLAGAAFFLADGDDFVGYSRFNLLLLPVFLGAGQEGVALLARGATRRTAAALLAVALGLSLWLSPFKADGTREPGWGCYRLATVEHDYPYREALRYLDLRHASSPVRVTGLDYPYSIWLYGRFPDLEQSLVESAESWPRGSDLDEALEAAARDGFPLVLVQASPGAFLPTTTSGYRIEAVFENDAHQLTLYRSAASSSKGKSTADS